MAIINNYATLQTAVADYLARDDLTTFVPNFIQNGEDKIYRTLNIRAEETSLSVSVASGVGALPTRFKKLKYAYVNEAPVTVLDWIPPENLYREYPTRSGAETPVVISREGSNFIFGPYPKDFTLSGIYYQKIEPLRTTDSSWYVVNAPEVLLYASLLEAAPFIQRDERLAIWQTMLDRAIETVILETQHADTSCGALYTKVA